MNILAIDPGLRGALALYDGKRLTVTAMPLIESKGQKPRLDEERLIRWIRGLRADLMVIEDVGGIPRQSAPAAFNFGYGVGFLCGAASLWGLPIRKIHAATWKSALKVPADKALAMARASELLPAYAALWPLKKDDGKAEAAMLALYAWQVFGPLEKAGT